jgi:hypothetical protein
MHINFKALGAGLLTAGPLLTQFGGAQAAWWIGVTFTALGPILLAIQTPPPKPRRKRKAKP